MYRAGDKGSVVGKRGGLKCVSDNDFFNAERSGIRNYVINPSGIIINDLVRAGIRNGARRVNESGNYARYASVFCVI